MRTLFIIALLVCIGMYASRVSTAVVKNTTIPTNSLPNPAVVLREGELLLKEGDLVLRLNSDPASQFIKNFNRRDKRYSHAGIVVYEKGYPYVYHMVNGAENPGERLRKDSLARFADPRKNTALGIYRYDLDKTEIIRLRKWVHQWYAKGIQFDSAFNYATDRRMYCTEMISKLLDRASAGRIATVFTRPTATEAALFSTYMQLPLSYTSQLQLVTPDNLFLHPACRLVKAYDFTKPPGKY